MQIVSTVFFILFLFRKYGLVIHIKFQDFFSEKKIKK